MDARDSAAPIAIPARRGAAWGLIIALLVATAGCGSDDDGATASAADAPTRADAATLRERIIGNTVTGTMSPDSSYTEFYAPDGTIHGASYEARWSIKDDRLCLEYDASPQLDCYAVSIDGKALEWHRQGEVQGTGTLVTGDPNNFQ